MGKTSSANAMAQHICRPSVNFFYSSNRWKTTRPIST